VLAGPLKELQNLGDLLFRKKIDLQVEKASAIRPPALAVLLHQHEGGQEYCLERNNDVEGLKRVRVERLASECADVEKDLDQEPQNVQSDEAHGSDKRADCVSDTPDRRSLALEFFL
jgi:hypothetical protein